MNGQENFKEVLSYYNDKHFEHYKDGVPGTPVRDSEMVDNKNDCIPTEERV